MDHQCDRDYEAANPGGRSPADRNSDPRQCAAPALHRCIRPRRGRTRSSDRHRLCILRRPGVYVETDLHDALDVYGKTKSLGECQEPNVYHLRCSIIGPEPKDFKFLIEDAG